ncbi:DUF5680 domain-containing protein [Paenibacillus kobensis]|uniref:DUF5680 domain-containing protein n=1 Tax=Paenibacillus kobensis TaxID=59841 RepID=UPI000FDA9AE0|nr:DUF5680 domain-containing protein [Paenibacillus kobensis]
MILNDEFITFLVEAKKNTYASGSGGLIEPIKQGSKDLSFKESEYEYMDSYFGELNFIGQEIVWFSGKPVWGMNYYGLTYDPIEGFPQFLFECLKQVTPQAPYRGPSYYKNNVFGYSCSWTGEINNFQGEESILFNNKVIYRLSFHGGNIQYL